VSIITARAIGEPERISPEQSQQWGVYAPESKDLDEVLQHACRLCEDHIDHLLSNPKRHPPTFTRLVSEFLLTRPGDLLDRLRNGNAVDWSSAFGWASLAELRKGIDAIRGEQISPEDARRDEMKATLEQLLEEKHPGEAKPPESGEGRCELIEHEGVLIWDETRIETFTDTEFLVLKLLWEQREKAHDLQRVLNNCRLKCGWSQNTVRNNFDRHKSGINARFRDEGYETPIKVINGKVRAWSPPQKRKENER
jgi:hypothetical protein